MSQSTNNADTRTIFSQFPRLSDDSELDKQAAIPTPTVPVPVHHLGASGVVIKKVSK